MPMWSVCFLYDAVGWAYYNNGRDLRKYAPPDFRVTLGRFLDDSDLPEAFGPEEPDFVVLNRIASIARVKSALDSRGWHSKIIAVWSTGWPRRIEALTKVLKHADLICFVNEAYWRNVGKLDRSVCIPIGVDLEVFRNLVAFENRPRRLLWIGSQINSTLKGYDAIAVPLREKLLRQGIECDFRLLDSFSEKNLSQEEMARWYNTGRVLLCTSSTEGTPNVALEAAACGCTLITTPVGNMPELIRHGENGLLVDPDPDAFYRAIMDSEVHWPSMASVLEKDIRSWGWDHRANELFSELRKIAPPAAAARGLPSAKGLVQVNGKSHPVAESLGGSAGPKVDLSSRVTVFVTTVGAPSFETCTRLLERQDCGFRTQIIANVAPMSAAFQRMLDDCQTEFYVQVDEDMLLYPHAVRVLFERMNRHPTNIALHVEYLYDAHIQRYIQGVKIFRHDIVKRYPFCDVAGCEIDQIQRLRSDGYDYAVVRPPQNPDPFRDTLGLHGTEYTRETAYLRYFVLQRQQRRRNSESWAMLNAELAEQFRKEPSDVNFFALMGSLAGKTAPLTQSDGEKDFRTYSDTPGFREVAKFYDAIVGRRGTP
jgi:glycosyltransferase involved in cell wall biosynthesis